MSSLRRINSSRANAARSRGPITPEGKERASTNALRHRFLAKCIVLENESSECFDDLVTQHIERLAPADGVEFAIVEEMVAANWRIRRAWAIENRLMEKAIRNQPPGDEVSRIAAAFAELAASPELNLLHRYEARLHRMYQRALNNLVMLGEPELPNEPSPISEHPAARAPSGDVREVDIPTPGMETGPLDAPLAPEGGGGLVSGCATVAQAVNPAVRVFGGEPVTMARPETIAGGLRAQPRAPDLFHPARTGGACGLPHNPTAGTNCAP